jgi:hypothetical protein
MSIIPELRYVADSSLNTYRPKHPLYERLNPAPPLLANGLLFLLAIIISAGAFKDYSTIKDVLAARPPPRRKFRIMEWADGVLDDPVFPEMSVDGPTKKTKNETAWGGQCSDWAKRADFTGGMGLHAARREILIKVDGKVFSLRTSAWYNKLNRQQTAAIR